MTGVEPGNEKNNGVVLATFLENHRMTPSTEFNADLYQDEIPANFRRFVDVIGDRCWLDQSALIAADIKRNQFLQEYLTAQNSMALALTDCSQAAAKNGNKLPQALTAQLRMLECHIFVSQTLQLIDAATRFSKKRGESLISRVRGAFKNPTDIQAMQLEARVATHFLRIGASVRFPELGSGRERFDLLVESLGTYGLEMECKAVTHDKGRKIHRLEGLEYRHKALPMMQRHALRQTFGLAVVVTVPRRMPGMDDFAAHIDGVDKQIQLGCNGTLQDGTEITLTTFSPAALGQLLSPMSLKNKVAVAKITGTRNREALICQSPGATGLVIFVLQSAQPDSLLPEVFATLADSAGRQLTGKRAGAFIGGFQGLERRALLELALYDGENGQHSQLAREASSFLERPEFPHVVGVGFLSAPDYTVKPDNDESKGVAYYFPKHTSPMWHPHFSGLFGNNARQET